MRTMRQYLDQIVEHRKAVGDLVRRFSTILRFVNAGTGVTTAAALSVGAAAAYQGKLSRANFAELAGELYDQERGTRDPHLGLVSLTGAKPTQATGAAGGA